MGRRLDVLRDQHPAFLVVAAVTVFVLVCWPVVDFYLRTEELVTKFRFADFSAYSGALNRWAEGGPIYVQDDAGGYHGSFLYPPVALLFFYPFATFEFETGALLMGALSLVLLWVGIEAAARVLGYEPTIGDRLILLVALFAFQPALRSLKWAQIPTLLTALLCFAFYAQELAEDDVSRGRWFRYASGGLTTVASSFKVFFATSGAHLLRDRQRFAGAMVTAAGLLVVSIAVFGVEAHRTYADVLLWGKGWGDQNPLYLWGKSTAYHPLYVFGPLAMPLKAIGLIGVVALALLTRNDDGVWVRRSVFALGVAVIPLFAPSADSHDLVVLLLPAIVLLAGELARPGGVPTIPVLAVLFVHLHRYVLDLALRAPTWLPFNEFVGQQAAWFQPAMWATLLLVGLATYRIITDASVTVSRPSLPSPRS